MRFTDTIEGDIPVLIEVGHWRYEALEIQFALWPCSDQLSIEACRSRGKWPGDVFGFMVLDRRIGLRLCGVGEFHCRVVRKPRLDNIAGVPLDDRMVENF